MAKRTRTAGDLLWLAGVSLAVSAVAAVLVALFKIKDQNLLHAVSWIAPFLVGYWCCSRDRRLERQDEISHEKLEVLLKKWKIR